MKFKELAQLGKDEQEQKLKELQLELIKLNSQVATGTPPKNAGQLKRLKKDIARIMLLKSKDEKNSRSSKTEKILVQRKKKAAEQRKGSEPKEASTQKTRPETK
ncbi:MAG TPA: 50S ribosomal protein L29 [Candidatus Nanoarchaeia archaeon]|nr:50S ribosomal protein L29 [Candidatus Nanoarchaeia archaeon]